MKDVTPSSGRTIRFRLASLVLICVLPVWLAGASLIFYTYQAKRALTEDHMLDTARTLRQAVDQELTAIQAAMRILATSPSLTAGDLAAFDRQARDVLSLYPGADIILADHTGQQLVNTYKPFGAPLPKRNTPETVRRIFDTGTPVISGLFTGKITGRHLISVDVAVSHGGRVVYDLAITFPAERLASLLQRHALPDNSFSTILDNSSNVVARSRQHDAFVGQPAPAVSPEGAASQEGMTEVVSLDGVPVIVAFSRSPLSRWILAVSIPKSVAVAELRTWLFWTASGATVFSLLAVGLALATARGMAGAVETLAASARAVGRGEPVSAEALSVTEATDVLQALATASQRLHRHSADRDRVESDLKEARAEAERANVSKSKFLAAASHDLRQPLQAMGMFLSVLEEQPGAPDKGLMANLQRCHASLSELLSDMLDISKLDAGVITPNLTAFPVQDLLEQVVASQKPSAQAKGLPLRMVGTRTLGHSDCALLQRVLINFLSNAVRYTHQGGVLIGCRRRHGRRWVEVWDTGIGISEDKIGVIFEEFQQLANPERSSEKGSGLGLAIVRKTAVLLGHEIRVSSTPGKGSVFAIELPTPSETAAARIRRQR